MPDAIPVTSLSLDGIGRLLGALAARPGPLPKHLYPSAGTLYPVQGYLSVPPPGLPGLPAGAWCYDAEAHALAQLGPDPAPAGEAAPFHLILVAELAAIAPAYPEQAEAFCLLEAGYMAEALAGEAAAAGLRLEPASDPAGWDGAALAAALRLGPGHRPLAAWAGAAA